MQDGCTHFSFFGGAAAGSSCVSLCSKLIQHRDSSSVEFAFVVLELLPEEENYLQYFLFALFHHGASFYYHFFLKEKGEIREKWLSFCEEEKQHKELLNSVNHFQIQSAAPTASASLYSQRPMRT